MFVGCEGLAAVFFKDSGLQEIDALSLWFVFLDVSNEHNAFFPEG
jgi:hypothetical protein